MIGLLISWGIVAIVFAMCIDWVKALRDIWESFIDALIWLGETAENLFRTVANLLGKGTERILYVVIVLPANYLNGYTYTGRHRRDNARQPTDSEVDRWGGADDRFADFLHTLNLEVHMNDQARA